MTPKLLGLGLFIIGIISTAVVFIVNYQRCIVIFGILGIATLGASIHFINSAWDNNKKKEVKK